MVHKDRVERLAGEMERLGLDAVYIGPSSDAEYIADLRLFNDERVKGLMISKKREIFVMTPLLYREELCAALGDEVSYQIWADQEGFLNAFREGCESLGLAGGRIAINDGVRAVDLINMLKGVNFEFVDGTSLLSPLRRRKDTAELECLRKAAERADSVMDVLSKFIKVGMTEKEIKDELIRLFAEKGAPEPAFPPIVAAGANASMPHYTGDAAVIRKGDFVVIDMGCKYKGYRSDTTRTFCMGEPNDEQRKIYETVLRAQIAGEEAVAPGATGQDVDRAARKIIEDAGYGQYFLNRVGHGVGLAIHEEPYMVEGNSALLEPGNVFSVEPGIYISGTYGVRIENLVAVRPDGSAEALNKFARDLIVIE
jgi:Xaa-Pro aminopeptidase